jgi:hypothetical protein
LASLFNLKPPRLPNQFVINNGLFGGLYRLLFILEPYEISGQLRPLSPLGILFKPTILVSLVSSGIQIQSSENFLGIEVLLSYDSLSIENLLGTKFENFDVQSSGFVIVVSFDPIGD